MLISIIVNLYFNIYSLQAREGTARPAFLQSQSRWWPVGFRAKSSGDNQGEKLEEGDIPMLNLVMFNGSLDLKGIVWVLVERISVE